MTYGDSNSKSSRPSIASTDVGDGMAPFGISETDIDRRLLFAIYNELAQANEYTRLKLSIEHGI